MSYILDALRRAQAERERGQVPGLHAQPGLGGAPRMRAATAGPAARPPWLWAVGGAALVALVLVPLLLLTRGGGGPPAAAPAGGAAVQLPAGTGQPEAPPLVVVSASPGAAKVPGTPAGTAAVPAVPRAGVAPAPVPSPAAANTSSTAPTALPRGDTQPAPAGQAAGPAPGTATAGVPQPAAGAGVAAADAPAPPAAPAATAAAAPAPPGTAAARNPAPAPAALPPMLTAEQRREWPALSLGGSVWSETPSARFVILGGQVVREGDSTPDGVQVERITPKAVVLRWRDQRAALPF